MSAWDSFTNFFNGGQSAAPAINGSTIAGYHNMDLSNWQPGGAASVLQNPSTLSMAGTAAPGTDPSLFQSFFGYSNENGFQPGWGGMALNAAGSLGNAWMGMKQYGLAQDALKENKRQFNINYGAQKKMLNSQLEDRQRARVAANPGAYQSVDSYMNQNRI